MKILNLKEIKARIDLPKIIAMQEEGFLIYSTGQVNIPPLGYLKQIRPSGSYHIKYDHIKDDPVWVVKIAGGPEDLPLNGMMLVFSSQTGAPNSYYKIMAI